MTTIYLTAGTDLAMLNDINTGERPKLQSCVSIVVDDVDGDDSSCSTCNQYLYPASPGCGIDGGENEVFDDNADARSDISQCSKGSRGSTSREESETRLQQIKDEVRHRRDEFARLLDEHEQVVRELRRIESSSELQSMAEITGSRAEEAMLSDFAPASGERQEE